jgi:hypothetical protein
MVRARRADSERPPTAKANCGQLALDGGSLFESQDEWVEVQDCRGESLARRVARHKRFAALIVLLVNGGARTAV